MLRQVTKASVNRYCQARLEAAKYNDRFSSRASAAAELGCVAEASLKKYELGLVKPPNDIVALMADAYGTPELAVWYCASECPLGKHTRPVPEMPPERMVVRLSNKLSTLQEVISEVSGILDDGTVDTDERSRLMEIRDELVEINRRLQEAVVTVEKLILGR